MAADPSLAIEIAQQLVDLLSASTREELRLVCSDSEGVALSALSDQALLEFERFLPRLMQFDHHRARVLVGSPAVRGALVHSLRRAGKSDQGFNHPARLIRAAIAAGKFDVALDEFERGGGAFFAYVHGVETAQRIVNTFPETVRIAHEQLVLAEIINTMKSGNISHAKFLMVEHFGAAADRLDMMSDHKAFSADFMCCRLVMAVCEEERISDQVLADVFRIIEVLPSTASMQKGMLYNVALDAFFRRRSWSTAEEAALRAKYHFNNARAALPAFYIDLYLALIELARGNIATAQSRLDLARVVADGPVQLTNNDLHLLAVLDHICAYERGDTGPLTHFLLTEIEHSPFDEVWPSIAWPIIAYGSVAMATTVTLGAARAYLERWRLQQWQSQRFSNSVALAEIFVLQSHDRWRASDEMLLGLTHVAGENYLRDAAPLLSDMSSTENIGFVLGWCRSMLETMPNNEQLATALIGLAANAHLTARERMTVQLWLSVSAMTRADWEQMRAALSGLADVAQSSRIISLLNEQRPLLNLIGSNREAMRHLSTSPRISEFMRENRDDRNSPAASNGLTRQEARVLLLLTERASNKLIARRLGLSVATVRFHLKNIYRKLGVQRRDGAVKAGLIRGIVSA